MALRTLKIHWMAAIVGLALCSGLAWSDEDESIPMAPQSMDRYGGQAQQVFAAAPGFEGRKVAERRPSSKVRGRSPAMVERLPRLPIRGKASQARSR